MLSPSASDVYTQPCILPLVIFKLTALGPHFLCLVVQPYCYRFLFHDSALDRGRMVQNLEMLESCTLGPCSIPFSSFSSVELLYLGLLNTVVTQNVVNKPSLQRLES